MCCWRKRNRGCLHGDLRGIYGDEINAVGGYRLQCRDCGKLVDGPVELAERPKYQWEVVP